MAKLDAEGYPLATPHDPIAEIFPDIFLVRGSYQLNPIMRFNRNMFILRYQDELCVVNSVRLSAAGEAELDALGKVRHVLRLGYFHGQDDRYYVDRYGAEFWAPRASRANPGPAINRSLEENAPLPFPGMQALLFKQSRHPEAVLLIEREGGILLACDALQYYADRRYCSWFARLFMPLMGFPLDMIVGPIWLKGMTPANSSLRGDFERVLALEFRHFVAAHGSVLRDDAKAAAAGAVERALGS